MSDFKFEKYHSFSPNGEENFYIHFNSVESKERGTVLAAGIVISFSGYPSGEVEIELGNRTFNPEDLEEMGDAFKEAARKLEEKKEESEPLEEGN